MAELSLAALATADLAIKYGKILIDLYTAFRDANDEVKERLLIIKVNWTRTRKQIVYLKSIWDTLDEEHQAQQGETLDVLVLKLRAAIAQIERVQRKKPGKGQESGDDDEVKVKRWKYAMIKESIDQAIQELDKWQKLFDPSWFLTLSISSSIIDQELSRPETDDEKTLAEPIATARGVRTSLKVEPKRRNEDEAKSQRPIFLPEEKLGTVQRRSIPHCPAQLLQRSADRYYVVDTIRRGQGVNSPRALAEYVRELARKLQAADPTTFGLLQCKGVVRHMDSDNKLPVAFDFIFNFPPTLEKPQSLRQILLKPDHNISLSDRFNVAQQLARSISYIHLYKFVHKNVQPETILIFSSPSSSFAASFLVGFEKIRNVHGNSMRISDGAWERDLYRHPSRQGKVLEQYYVMQHDIYSLGVCLLEIGLWESFVRFDNEATPSAVGLQENKDPPIENEGEHTQQARSELETLHIQNQIPLPSPLLPSSTDKDLDKNFEEASLVKDALVQIAKDRLPSRMGNKYTNVVVNCLTCLDEGNADFGNESEFEDEEGILIGVRYIQKVSYFSHDLTRVWVDIDRFCCNSTIFQFNLKCSGGTGIIGVKDSLGNAFLVHGLHNSDLDGCAKNDTTRGASASTLVLELNKVSPS